MIANRLSLVTGPMGIMVAIVVPTMAASYFLTKVSSVMSGVDSIVSNRMQIDREFKRLVLSQWHSLEVHSAWSEEVETRRENSY